MKILAVESADGAASIAYSDGNESVLLRNEEMRDSLSWFMQQAEVLREKYFQRFEDLDALACCIGPGGFTGVRVAVGYIQGLGMATGLPCIAVNSLDAMATALELNDLADDAAYYLALDARMQELYLARYQYSAQGLRRDGELKLMAVSAAVAQLESNSRLAGPGFEASAEVFQQDILPAVRLDALAVLRAAQALGLKGAVAAKQLEPVYLRNQVAKTLVERGLATPK